MPVIVFASSKGGAGKTTVCVALACEFARQCEATQMKVALLDADPNQHSARWAKLSGKPENIDIIEGVSEESILDMIDEAKKKASFVLVDLEGVASNVVTYAVSQANLVIIPCQASENDAQEAVKTIKNIRNSARIIGRSIPHVVLFARTSAAILTKTAKYLREEFEHAGVHLLNVPLVEREAFRSIFSFGGSVNMLDASTKRESEARDKASQNIFKLAEEVKKQLKTVSAIQKTVEKGEV